MEQMLRRELAPIMVRPIANVSRLDIRAVLADKGETHMANRLHSALRTMWRWFIDQELASVSPIPLSRPLKTEESRQRVLSDDELASVWRATEDRPGPLRAIVRTLILTGQRREEVAEMRRSELDLASGTWTIGAERYKTKTDHVVPLVPAVLALIEGQHRIAGSDWVFTSNGRNAMRLSNEGTTLKRLTPEIADWRLHDLRRTFRTGLARLKVSRETADLIDHPRGGVTGTYDRHLYIGEKRAALELWAAHVASILT
jgi:integrase